MKRQKRLFSFTSLLLLCALAGGANAVFGDIWQDQQRDALSGLRSAIAQAGATALTADQETQLNALLAAFEAAQPADFDENAGSGAHRLPRRHFGRRPGGGAGAGRRDRQP